MDLIWKEFLQVAPVPNRGEWLDVWDSERKVWLFSRTLKMASSSTTASSEILPLLLTESGERMQIKTLLAYLNTSLCIRPWPKSHKRRGPWTHTHKYTRSPMVQYEVNVCVPLLSLAVSMLLRETWQRECLQIRPQLITQCHTFNLWHCGSDRKKENKCQFHQLPLLLDTRSEQQGNMKRQKTNVLQWHNQLREMTVKTE